MAIYGISYINENYYEIISSTIDEFINEFYIDESFSPSKVKDSLVKFVVGSFKKLMEIIRTVKQKVKALFTKKRAEKITEKLKIQINRYL